MQKDKNSPKINILSRWFGDGKTTYMIIIIATFFLIIAGVFLNRKLEHTKFELESCRSSCSSSN